jgi:hypothetical protein
MFGQWLFLAILKMKKNYQVLVSPKEISPNFAVPKKCCEHEKDISAEQAKKNKQTRFQATDVNRKRPGCRSPQTCTRT